VDLRGPARLFARRVERLQQDLDRLLDAIARLQTYRSRCGERRAVDLVREVGPVSLILHLERIAGKPHRDDGTSRDELELTDIGARLVRSDFLGKAEPRLLPVISAHEERSLR